MSDVAIVQGVMFLTVLAGFVGQWLREARQRRWDVEDRRRLAESVLAAAMKAERSVLAKTTELHEAIEKNTKISTKAFHEANSVNLKIESLGLEHNALERKKQAKGK